MIYTVTFNPALDYLMYVSELQSDDINRTEKEQIFYGGKGINVSVILTRLGVKNKALGFLAGFSGHQIENMLNADGIENDFVYLKNGYTMLYPVSTGALMRMTALMYNADTLNLIDKGQMKYDEGNDARLRRAVWGIFESKETGKQFAVVSTHFDCIRENEEELMLSYMKTQVKQINEISDNIKGEYGVPVFCIGDFNTMNPGEGVDPVMDAPEIYAELCKTLTDTRLVALEKESGDSLDTDAPTWDHIFLNGEAQINRYAIVSPQALSEMSDHYPIFTDVTV